MSKERFEAIVAALGTPYFSDGKRAIYCGDCRELLPLIEPGSVDLVLTDPPYGMEFRSNYRIVRHAEIAGDDELPVEEINLLIRLARRATYAFCRWDNLSHMPKPRSVLAWVKNNWSMGDLKHEHGRQWEACCFYPTEQHEFIKRIPDVIFADRTGNELHPTQKPVALASAIIAANVGDLILDPFMGSGTTLRAAKDLDRYAIGIELEREYCEIAKKRLAQSVLEFAETEPV